MANDGGNVDLRLVQLARLLGHAGETLSAEAARRQASERSAWVAASLLGEAADSDDVTSAAGAREYLEDRLAYLGDLLDEPARDAVRAEFNRQLRAWE